MLQCWGYWYSHINRNGERLDTKVLMDDQRGENLWAIEKHTNTVLCHEGNEYCIDGTYMHIHCKRAYEIWIPFESLTCGFCKMILECDEFRMNLYHDSKCANKRHERDTRRGRRLEYLTQNELKIAARVSDASQRSTM